MRKINLVVVIVALLVAGAASAKVVRIHFNHAEQLFYVDQADKAGTITQVRWDNTVVEGDTIDLIIDRTPLGLFEIHTKRTNKPDNSLGSDIAKKLGIQLATPTGTDPTSTLYTNARDAADAFNKILNKPSEYKAKYEDDRLAAQDAFEALLKRANVSSIADVDTIVDAVFTKLGADPVPMSIPKATLKPAIQLMKDLYPAGPLGSSEAATFDADQEFDVVISWKKPDGSSINVPPDQQMIVRFASKWIISTTAGFGFSRLVDQNYTTQTLEVTAATADKPAVTKKIAVHEKDDVASPDATLFVHVTPVGEAFRDWPVGLPRQLTFGVGIGSNSSGRSYLGFSWALGRAASLTVGAAGGKVKVLSRNVDVNNLGTTDPQASRRDVFHITPFLGISWRIGDSAASK
jgi:hypothetical protein